MVLKRSNIGSLDLWQAWRCVGGDLPSWCTHGESERSRSRFWIRFALFSVSAPGSPGCVWLPIRLFSGRVSEWYHTPHGESS